MDGRDGEARDDTAARRAGTERLMEPLRANMPADKDISFEGIRSMGNPVPLLVQNDGTGVLQLWLEPFGQDYWLNPGESVYVTSYGMWNDHPFEVVHEQDCITVWATSWFATVSDLSGAEFPAGSRS
ncbi:hypothetical protein [Streptomyces sp. NRRL F-5123]|uniref:hypothetical protein n=1 Tax=Streptomyces sp. NRRL F-5123 TaxID=1463856 RepID=UPI00131CEBC9|nr:hypothetical protein [Streptomyces sp. NRRL F-5123]